MESYSDISAAVRLSEITARQLSDHRVTDYVRWLSCHAYSEAPQIVANLFAKKWPDSPSLSVVTSAYADFERRFTTKAAVPPATTTDPAWAGPLYGVAPLADAFVQLVRSASLLGRIPGLRVIPFRVQFSVETQGASYYWVAQGAPKPIGKMAFDQGVTLGPTKIVGIVVVTDELAKLTSPGMEGALRTTLIAGLTEFTDRQFLDPAVGIVPDVHPPSITNGLTPVASTGDLVTDVATLLQTFYTARPSAENAVLIMGGAAAAALTGVSGRPGTAYGLPVLISAAALNNVIVLDPGAVFVADGGVKIEVSKEASVQMVDTPTDPPTAGTSYVNLWQSDLTGFMTERYVNWQPLPGAVQYLALS
jgi:hypothetical protein